MLTLKEKDLNELEEKTYVSIPKRRMPSRANYYANVQEAVPVPVKKEDYTIEFVRGGKAVASNVEVSDDLDISASNLTAANLKQYEKMSSNLVPSGATMRALDTRKYVEEDESADEAVAFKVNRKGLIMLLVYAAVIIGIFAAIILNAISLVNLTNTTSALDAENSLADANLEILNKQLADATDPDAIRDWALNNGMIEDSDVAGTLHIVQDVPEQQILQGSNNLYDWVLDTGLIGIIAGGVVLLGGGIALFVFITGKRKMAKQKN